MRTKIERTIAFAKTHINATAKWKLLHFSIVSTFSHTLELNAMRFTLLVLFSSIAALLVACNGVFGNPIEASDKTDPEKRQIIIVDPPFSPPPYPPACCECVESISSKVCGR